jgi:hypothetical protein
MAADVCLRPQNFDPNFDDSLLAKMPRLPDEAETQSVHAPDAKHSFRRLVVSHAGFCYSLIHMNDRKPRLAAVLGRESGASWKVEIDSGRRKAA